MNLEGNLTSKQALKGVLAIRQGIDGKDGEKGDAGSIEFKIVAELPTEDISESCMYLLKTSAEEGNNKFMEYIYVDGTWECIGSTTVEVDLSEYVKKDDFATNSIFGLVVGNPTFGVNVENGKIYVQRAVEEEIDKKESAYKTITPSKLDYAVKKALSNCKLKGDDVWTDEEKASARGQIGASSDIITSASGEVVTTTDSAKAKPKNIKLFGKSKQDGMPSIETPIEVVSHGESGSIEGKVLTKNHFDIAKALDPNNWQLGTGLYSYFIIKGLQANTEYTFSFAKNEFAGEEYYVTITNSASSLDWESGSLVHPLNVYIKTKRTITASSDGCLYLHMYEVKNENLETLFAKCTEPQLELGTSRTTYEPYTKQPFTAPTPNGLRGIPLGQTIPDAIKNSPIHMNGVYWDEAEQQYYIADTKNENGRDVQRIGEYVVTGNEDYVNYMSDGFLTFQLRNIFVGRNCIFSTHGGAFVANDYYVGITVTEHFGVTSLEEFRTLARGLYNSDTPLSLYYTLAEPIVTDTDVQYDVVMNYPNTTVVNDAGAYMEVEYVADTKCYVDNKFKEMTSAIAQLL